MGLFIFTINKFSSMNPAIIFSLIKLRSKKTASVINSFFTLIELLIVISIIAILMTMLLPALKKARDRGKSIKCQSNLKQMGMALQSYANENNCFPPPTYRPMNDCPDEGWWYKLNAHITSNNILLSKAPDVFTCPAFGRTGFLTTLAYGYNGIRSWPNDTMDYQGLPHNKLFKFSRTSETVAIADSENAGQTSSEGAGCVIYWGDQYNSKPYWPAISRHDGNGGNFLLLDGHVEKINYLGTPRYNLYWYPNQSSP